MKETKDLILETAYQMFLSNNYEAVTISSIIKATGLTKGAIYHYYQSKEELFKAVIDNFLMKEHINSIVPIDFVDFKDLIKKYLENKKETFEKARRMHKNCDSAKDSENLLIQHLSLVVSANRYYPGYIEKERNNFIISQRLWCEALIKGVKAGELRADIDINLAVMDFIFLEATVAFYTLLKGDDLNSTFDLYEKKMYELYKNIEA